jgi:SAM-dependent methyltransferase
MSSRTPPDGEHDTEYLDGEFWTPQTSMLRSLRDWILACDDESITRALCIDSNPTLTNLVRRRWAGTAVTEASYPEHDVQDLAVFADGSFDLTYSHQVLEHVRKPWIAAAELLRVTRPGGLGIHTTCAANPRHGPPAFADYYRFLPDGLEALFDGAEVLVKAGWGNRQALAYNLAIDDGHGDLGGRRFHRALGEPNEENFPWHTWIIYRKR